MTLERCQGSTCVVISHKLALLQIPPETDQHMQAPSPARPRTTPSRTSPRFHRTSHCPQPPRALTHCADLRTCLKPALSRPFAARPAFMRGQSGLHQPGRTATLNNIGWSQTRAGDQARFTRQPAGVSPMRPGFRQNRFTSPAKSGIRGHPGTSPPDECAYLSPKILMKLHIHPPPEDDHDGQARGERGQRHWRERCDLR